MLKPPPNQNSSSYVGLQKRMIQALRMEKVDEQILETCQKVYDLELQKQNIEITRQEKVRLFRQVIRAILAEMMENLDKA